MFCARPWKRQSDDALWYVYKTSSAPLNICSQRSLHAWSLFLVPNAPYAPPLAKDKVFTPAAVVLFACSLNVAVGVENDRAQLPVLPCSLQAGLSPFPPYRSYTYSFIDSSRIAHFKGYLTDCIFPFSWLVQIFINHWGLKCGKSLVCLRYRNF